MKRITIDDVTGAYEFVKLTPEKEVFLEKMSCCAITALVLEQEGISGKNESSYLKTLSSSDVDFVADNPEKFFFTRLMKYYPELPGEDYLEGFVRGFDDAKPNQHHEKMMIKHEDYRNGIEDGAEAAAEVLVS